MSTAPRLQAAKRDWGHDETGCTVLHIDMDAFYASLEIARNPRLKGKPVIIGTGTRSVVSAASYEARAYGVNSAMATARARRLCPNGVFLPVDMSYYRMMSRRIFDEVFSQITDQIEQVSVDEGYMDVSGALRQWGRPSRIGAWIRAQVAQRYQSPARWASLRTSWSRKWRPPTPNRTACCSSRSTARHSSCR